MLRVGLLAVVMVACVWLPPQPGVTKANFHKIKLAMEIQEVTAIFGKQPHLEEVFDKKFDSSNAINTSDRAEWNSGLKPKRGAFWSAFCGSNQISVEVWFDENGKVVRAYYFRWWNGDTCSLIGYIRGWLGL